MELNYYQQMAKRTAVYPKDQGLVYTALGLNGEAGEVAEKIKKILRDNNGVVSPEARDALIKEAGDVLWYLANFAEELGVNLGTIASLNLQKLGSRQDRGVLHGAGDDR